MSATVHPTLVPSLDQFPVLPGPTTRGRRGRCLKIVYSTYPPLNAPTGLFVGTATVAWRRICDVAKALAPLRRGAATRRLAADARKRRRKVAIVLVCMIFEETFLEMGGKFETEILQRADKYVVSLGGGGGGFARDRR